MNIKDLSAILIICSIMLGFLGCSSNEQVLVIDDVNGILGEARAPVIFNTELNSELALAAQEGRLGIIAPGYASNYRCIPVQLEGSGALTESNLVMIMPEGEPGLNELKLVEKESPFEPVMKASLDQLSGQVMIEEGGEKVLQYNYETVYEKDVVYGEDEILEHHLRSETDTFVTSSIYAVPRSDYIHPLYGMEGEMLTRDWPEGGHPHHRAIFWAWPEVEYGNERSDIYALQRIFARPTGHLELTNGPVYAQIDAENLWMWEDSLPIVRENALIKVYRATETTRIIDLTIQLVALENQITIATRGTDSYGGLNLRMQTPTDQEISYFTDNAGSNPVRAWSDFNGIFKGNTSASGLMVLQYQANPDYPGQWVEYPDLAWVQPTFPSPGTRYPLQKEKPLVLRYRLIIHSGGKPDSATSELNWDAYHSTFTPIHNF
jgi:hypothetical protein